MTEPRVSYKGLEEPTNLFLVPRCRLVPTVLVTMLILSCASTDAAPAIANQKDVPARAQLSQTMMNHSSMSSVDTNNEGKYSSSFSSYESFDYSQDSSSLPMTVEEEGDGNEEIKPSCSEDQYLDSSSNTCRRCISCDPHAETIQKCTREQNTQCGQCPHGMYYFQENNCVPCEDNDTEREECMMTRPAPLKLIESSSLPFPETSDTSPAAPVEPDKIIIHTSSADETGTPAKGTESPTTEQTVHGGKPRTGGNEAITGVLVAFSTSAFALSCFLVFKLRQKMRKRGVKASTPGKDTDEESNCGNPEKKSVEVHYDVQNETIGYSSLPQQEPCHDETDQPQPLRSDLPFGHSQMGTVCPSCYGPVRQEDTYPTSLSHTASIPLQFSCFLCRQSYI